MSLCASHSCAGESVPDVETCAPSDLALSRRDASFVVLRMEAIDLEIDGINCARLFMAWCRQSQFRS